MAMRCESSNDFKVNPQPSPNPNPNPNPNLTLTLTPTLTPALTLAPASSAGVHEAEIEGTGSQSPMWLLPSCDGKRASDTHGALS